MKFMYREYSDVNQMYKGVLADLLERGQVKRFGALYRVIEPYIYRVESLQQNLLSLPGIDHNIFWMLQEFEDRIELRDPGYAWRFSKSYENKLTTVGRYDYAQFDSFLYYQEYLDRRIQQLDYIILQLRKIRPRAAVGIVWDPAHDLVLYTRRRLEYSEYNADDYQRLPCTIAYTFTISDGKLNFNVFMRANDLDRINPADMFMFGMLQKFVLSKVDPALKLGPYHHFVTSMAIRSYGGTHFDLWRKRLDNWRNYSLDISRYYKPFPESFPGIEQDWKLLLELTDNLRMWKFHQALNKVSELEHAFWRDWVYVLFIGEYLLKLSQEHHLVRTKKIKLMEAKLSEAFKGQRLFLLNSMLSHIQTELQFHTAKQLCNFYARTGNWGLIEEMLACLPSQDLWPWVLIGATKYLSQKDRDFLLRQFHQDAADLYDAFYRFIKEDEYRYTPAYVLEKSQ